MDRASKEARWAVSALVSRIDRGSSDDVVFLLVDILDRARYELSLTDWPDRDESVRRLIGEIDEVVPRG